MLYINVTIAINHIIILLGVMHEAGYVDSIWST